MKKLLFILLFLLVLGCEKDDIDDVIQLKSPKSLEVEDFIYKAMNYVYYWQKDVPNLADNKFSNDKEYTAFLQSFEGPTDLFNKLKYGGDRFSIITDDYFNLEKQLNSISLSNGMKFGLGSIFQDGRIFGYVRYVLPNSDAAKKGIKRGDIFTHVDGTGLTVNNFSKLLFSNKTSYTIDLAEINMKDQLIQFTGTSVTLINTEQQEKELHISKVITHKEKKVGYIMYNGFNASQEDDLKTVFAEFASQQIDELVVDLRYNPGGRISTAQLLAGLIAGEHAGKVFGEMEYNHKLSKHNEEIEIINSNIRLGLSRVLFLVSPGSASASEMVINGLNPYINTVLVGDTTYGKNVGSFVVYDLLEDNKTKNPNHSWALLPITFNILNSEGFGDYGNGIEPNFQLEEDPSNLGVLGDPNERLLKKALEVISGQVTVGSLLSSNAVLSTFEQIPIEQGRAIYALPEN